MKVNVSTPILDYEGKELTENVPKGKDKTVVTMRNVIHTALNTFARDENIDNADKDKFFELTVKAYESKEVEYTTEECAIIIDRVRKIYNPLVLGRVKQLLDPSKK